MFHEFHNNLCQFLKRHRSIRHLKLEISCNYRWADLQIHYWTRNFSKKIFAIRNKMNFLVKKQFHSLNFRVEKYFKSPNRLCFRQRVTRRKFRTRWLRYKVFSSQITHLAMAFLRRWSGSLMEVSKRASRQPSVASIILKCHIFSKSCFTIANDIALDKSF